jgi:hypothetical protein
MQRKPLFLVAAAAELGRFMALAFLAGAVGALRSGSGLPAFFRYAMVPQLLFAAMFFFLWYDQGRYGAYRPLGIAGKAVSLLAFIPLAISLITEGASMAYLSRQGAVAAIVTLGVDLAGLLLLCLYDRDRQEGGSVAMIEETGAPGAPRGPDDIEKVEG